MFKVCVYMSTYNGEKYIKEQIDSILNQKGVKIHLIIRDDGSEDSTLDIIEKYRENNVDNIKVIHGDNVGCEESFMRLLHYSFGADYYAFADQDDIWYPDKCISAINTIKNCEKPALATCNLLACNENMNPIKVIHTKEHCIKIEQKQKEVIFINMHGCVLLWNKALDVILKSFKPKVTVGHDSWVCAVAHIVGEMKVDSMPHIFYRLHGNNVSGYALNCISRVKKGIKIYCGKGHPQRDLFAKQLIKGYGKYLNQNSKAYKNIEAVANYKSSYKAKIALINSEVIRYSEGLDRAFWIFCILIGTY